MILLRFICPVVVVALGVCLGIQRCYFHRQSLLKDSFQTLKSQRDSLFRENQALYKENIRLNSIREQHIKLDISGIFHKEGGDIFNNNMGK